MKEFQMLIVEYPDICLYKENIGKPYFSIKYIKDGRKMIGYGTYKPESLSRHIREDFIQSELEDIKREIDGLDTYISYNSFKPKIYKEEVLRIIDKHIQRATGK